MIDFSVETVVPVAVAVTTTVPAAVPVKTLAANEAYSLPDLIAQVTA